MMGYKRERRRNWQLAAARLAALVVVFLLVVTPAPLAQEAPLAEDAFEDATEVSLDDGTYQVDVSMEGGSGRASITTPTQLVVEDGRAVATIEWSSPNYDYMLVGDKRYLPINEEGNSTFEIPVLVLDEPFVVIGDTTAMSVPHEVDYQLTFDSTTIVRETDDEAGLANRVLPVLVAVCATGAIVAVVLRRRQA
ncbi:MAG: hypothetical protein II128_05135 [Atopobiaceae bacterium]|nr:hypothetical protein [Atopobiaceae bacterium]